MTKTMKPGEWRTRDGKPAIVWYRPGVAASGEPSVVEEVRTYASEEKRFDAHQLGLGRSAEDSDNQRKMRYFHGSMERLDVGIILRGRGADYAQSWSNTDFYKVLEALRPQSCLSHAQAVFAVTDPDDIDLAGGGTEWIFELATSGPVSKHDLNWSSEIGCLLSDGFQPDSVEVRNAASNYWTGVPHTNESVWEYLMPEATIILVAPYDDFQMDDVAEPQETQQHIQRPSRMRM